MSKLKCPFCQQELKDQWVGQYVAHEYFDCPKCKMNGNPKLWEVLIRTRRALDVAVDALKDFSIHPDNSVKKYAKKALEQITAEQKD